mmetsp:Transcript_31238/g.47667  ORF Transcript_31238/g.47667 Transcript_31238/m.47667 type:complete len:610 (+) Transcript_31238:153-1982(+)
MSNDSCSALTNNAYLNVLWYALISLGVLFIVLKWKGILHQFALWLEYFTTSVPTISVELELSDDNKDTIKGSQPLVDPKQPHILNCYNPSSGCGLPSSTSIPNMSEKDVDEVCQAAHKAQKEWSETTFAQRRLVLRVLQKWLVNHSKEICQLCALDSGKTHLDALLGEVLTTCEKTRTLLSEGELWLQNSYRSTGPLMMHKDAFVQYVPVGVLGVIAPWNYPFHNLLNHILSGLFAGNAVVTKVSEQTSWSSVQFLKIARQALIVCGHSPDLVQLVTGLGPSGAALVDHPLVGKIIFTGSPQVGAKVMAGCAPHVKPVTLELGGKDPMVLTEDVKMEAILPWVMRGCFQNCGQNCCGIERVYAYDSIYETFLGQVKPLVEALKQGNPNDDKEVPDCGAMVMEQQLHLIQSLVDDAVKKGAKILVGGKFDSTQKGNFYPPTLLVDVTNSMRIAKEEVFGPVMAVSRVPKDSDEECLRLLHEVCPFGLGASVYSGSQERAFKGIGQHIQSGMLTINDFGVNYLIQSLPFGGWNESGFGRFAGPEGLRACCHERSIVLDKLPSMIRTSIPPPLQYPMTKSSFEFGNALIQLFYNDGSILAKLKAIVTLCKGG